MSNALTAPLTLDSFLAWEREQELRYEFDGVQPIAMTGGSVAHSVIAQNIVTALGRGLPPGCRTFRGDLKIIVQGRVRYPDAMVTCTPVDDEDDTIPDPVVVFEVLSPSTAVVDRIVKNDEYRATPSIRHYVMLEQRRMAATVFSREGEAWRGQIHVGPTVIPLPAIGATLALADLYAGVALRQDDPPDPTFV
ncbi:MAG: Uma2 family endonuclease [Acetobacteraceae bacterium]|nr:Uma2 family endonuclease [Acetobacteraceae bacterium]